VPFASINQMKGSTLSRKDDLESLFYTLVNLFQISLKKLVT